MNFELSEEQLMIQKTIRDFSEEHIKPIASQLDETKEFPLDNMKKLGELGFLGMTVPEQYGGAGLDSISYCIAVEEVSRVCAATGVCLSVHNSLACDPLLIFGTEEQKNKYLTPMARGEKIGCFCLTEPEAGSDAANQRTTAVLKGDKYILNGSKQFITNGEVADTSIVFAMTDREAGTKGISAFILDKDFPGYKIGKIKEMKLGIRGSGTAEIFFEDCEVPKENLLEKEGKGFKVAMVTLDCGRIGIAAQAVGIAQGALDIAVQYAKERSQFGKSIGRFQAIQWMLADMATETDAARMLTYRAAGFKDEKKRFSKEAAMAKCYASDSAMQTTIKAVQVLGGYGYMNDYVVERFMRDAKITQIYEGTNEIQRMVIAANILA
jgi:butyryl-CoA dehydrogenase